MADDFTIRRRNGKIYNEFTVEGLKDIEKEFMRMEKELRTQEGQSAMTSAMKPVMANVKGNIRRQGLTSTESLLRSGRITNGHVKPQDLVCDVRFGTDRRGSYKRNARASANKKGDRKPAYALQNEYGTEDSAFGPTKERPFMRPAFDGKEVQIAERLKQRLKNRIIRFKLP
jgi:HK97 gp10 family phage protein